MIALFILPELYCLYQQFDLHPEKTVFGKNNVSGIRFFFWDSQFGRFFNTGPIKGKGSPVFYFHTVLWAFLPWSILLFVAITSYIKRNFRKPGDHEWYCLSAGLASFLLFSASRFQLPHYLNIVYPFFAILVAQYLNGIVTKQTAIKIRIIQNVVIFLFLFSPFLLQVIFKPSDAGWLVVSLLAVTILIFFVAASKVTEMQQIVYKTALASFCLNSYLNLIFFPSLTRYQAGSEAALWINRFDRNVPVFTTEWSSPYIFYLNRDFRPTDTSLQGITEKKFLLYLSNEQACQLIEAGRKVRILKVMDDYPVTRLNMKFINNASRNKTVRKMDVVQVMQ
jgi:hypothetical protein